MINPPLGCLTTLRVVVSASTHQRTHSLTPRILIKINISLSAVLAGVFVLSAGERISDEAPGLENSGKTGSLLDFSKRVLPCRYRLMSSLSLCCTPFVGRRLLSPEVYSCHCRSQDANNRLFHIESGIIQESTRHRPCRPLPVCRLL